MKSIQKLHDIIGLKGLRLRGLGLLKKPSLQVGEDRDFVWVLGLGFGILRFVFRAVGFGLKPS